MKKEMTTEERCLFIRDLHRQRDDFLRTQTSLTLRIKAICRRSVPKTDKHEAGDKTVADKLYSALVKGIETTVALAGSAVRLTVMRSTLHAPIKDIEKQMEREAKALPFAWYLAEVKGFGALGLAQIVGEAGDLTQYKNPAKLWKRMGLAPYKGKSCREWRVSGGLDKLDWVEAGYSPRRRSVMFVLGEALIKHDSYIREVYYARKVYEQEKHPDKPKMFHHMRAHRYMEKRLLRDLWRAANRPQQLREVA